MGEASLTTNAYQPNPVYIKKGQTIVWTNKDNNMHTVTQKAYSNFASDDDNTFTRFNSGMLIGGQSFFQTFSKKGIYDYYCTIHPWMVGQMIVSANSNPVNNNTNTTSTDTINNKNKTWFSKFNVNA